MSILTRLFSGQEKVRDPVCGMTIPATRARDFAVYDGKTYHFCSPACREQFERAPLKFIGRSAGHGVGV